MSDTILLRIRRGTVQTLAEAVQTWAGRPLDAEQARDVRDALRICRSWPDELQDACESLWRRASANQVEDYQKAGELFLELVDQAGRTLETLGQRTQDFERQGRALPGVAEVKGIKDKLGRFRQQFVDSWPWVTEAVVQEALAEYARGDSRTVEEILEELEAPEGRNKPPVLPP